VSVTVAPVQVEGADHTYEGTYDPPRWLSRFAVAAGEPAQFKLELLPRLLYVEHCLYGQAFHVWRFQGALEATLSNAGTGEVLEQRDFVGDMPPACPAQVTVTQLGDRITWPSDDDLIAWLEGIVGEPEASMYTPLTDAGLARLESVGNLVGAARPPQVLAFSPDSRYLAAGGEVFDPVVYVWDTAAGELVGTFALGEAGSFVEVGAIAFSADGQLLAAVSGINGNILRIWDIPQRQLLRELEGFEFPGTGLVFSGDAGSLALSRTSQEVDLLDIASGEIRLTLPVMSARALTFDVQDTHLLSVGMCGELSCVQTWDLATGELVAQLDLPVAAWQAAFSANGQLLAISEEDRVQVWDITTGQLHARLSRLWADVAALAFDAGGTSLAVTTTNAVTVCQLSPLDCRVVPFGDAQPLPMAISPDFTAVVSGKWYSELTLWRGAP
jgi:WD40 repeat protein